MTVSSRETNTIWPFRLISSRETNPQRALVERNTNRRNNKHNLQWPRSAFFSELPSVLHWAFLSVLGTQYSVLSTRYSVGSGPVEVRKLERTSASGQ